MAAALARVSCNHGMAAASYGWCGYQHSAITQGLEKTRPVSAWVGSAQPGAGWAQSSPECSLHAGTHQHVEPCFKHEREPALQPEKPSARSTNLGILLNAALQFLRLPACEKVWARKPRMLVKVQEPSFRS